MSLKRSGRMVEALRLTRAGKLAEATALLRRIGGESVAGASGRAVAPSGMSPAGERIRPAPFFHSSRASPGGLRAADGSAGDALSRTAVPPAGRWRDEPSSRPGRFEERSFTGSAGTRAYKLFLPSRAREGRLPLVVMLHGCKQTPDDFAAGTGMNRLGEELGFAVAYPAQDASANPARCWNWFVPAHQSRVGGEPSLIAGITERIARELPIDRTRVYVAGLSAGGAAAAVVANAYPELYAAVGVHSGLPCGAARDLPSALKAMREGGDLAPYARVPLPTIVFHGDRDGTVNPVNGDEVIAQARSGARLVATVTHGRSPGGVAYTRTVETDESGRTLLEQWVLHGSQHAWSGGSAAGSYTDPRGPDASREMVRFFLQHAKAPA